MLVNAYGNITEEELNKLIREGNYKYLDLSANNYFEAFKIDNSDWNKIQKISMDNEGNVLGYFSCNVNVSQQKIEGTCFVKFRYIYDKIATKEDGSYRAWLPKELETIVNNDFKQFVDEIMNHPLYNRAEIMAVKDNPANKTYEKWLDKYNGERFLFKDYIKLADGNLYDVWIYWFRRGEK